MWLVILSVVATMLLIAYVLDRRGRVGAGMTDRGRHEAAKIFRDQENQAWPLE
jgi:putative exporter of polyketide antibiotics